MSSPGPQLRAILVDKRPAVIVSYHDLSLGVMGIRYFPINGYSIDSARQLMLNLLLSVR